MLSFFLLTLLATSFAAVLALLSGRGPSRSSLYLHAVGVSGPLVAALAGLATALQCWNLGRLTALSGLISVDAWSALLLSVIALVSGLSALYSIPYMGREVAHGKMTRRKLGW